MQFPLEKSLRLERKKMDWFIQTVIVPVDGLCYKIVQPIYQVYKKFFHLSQNVYHGTEKKR